MTQRPLSDFPCPNTPLLDVFGFGCRCPDCWHEDEDIRAEMRYAGAIRRRADAELLAAGITELIIHDPVTGERALVKMGVSGVFPVPPEKEKNNF